MYKVNLNVDFEKNLLEENFKRFFRTKEVGTISSTLTEMLGRTKKRELKGLFNLQPKNNYLRSSSKKAELVLREQAKRLFKRKRA